MNAIVSVCEDWGIGNKGKLLVRNHADMQRFRELTLGEICVDGNSGENLVVMGRVTAESFPGGRPLSGRRNIVLSRNADWTHEGFEVVSSMSELEECIGNADPDRVWLIGGELIYRLLLDECDRVFVTKNACVREADAFFPNLDEDPAWELEEEIFGGTTGDGVDFSFVTYKHV